MVFKAGRYLAAALVISLFLQMLIAGHGYASRRTKIAFISFRDGNEEIYVMDGDGRNRRRVTVNPARDVLPTWAPNGAKIAFVSNRNNENENHRQIWVIDADGKNPIRLSDGLVDTYPDWSPDGTKIMYNTDLVPEDDNLAPDDIIVMDADGKDKRVISDNGLHPSWSPDGKRIVCTNGRQLYVMDADGRNRTQLTHDVVRKRLPSWSHDGTSIAYVGNNVIWVVDSDGENPRQLTEHVTESHPTWSPDSESIAFHSYERDPRIVGIYTVDVTDGAVDALRRDPDSFNLEPDWFYRGGLSVSPEGSRITIWGRLKKFASSAR